MAYQFDFLPDGGGGQHVRFELDAAKAACE